MVCTLYYARGGKQKLEDVANVQEGRKMVVFTFLNGTTLNVLSQHLLHYELHTDEAVVNKPNVQDVFNRFDHFVNNFVNNVEHAVNAQSRYSISVNELDRFKKLLHSRRNARMSEARSLQSLKW